jgi:putative endonuclease
MWYIYMIRCGDNSLYTGIATDVERRFEEHQRDKGARYLRGRGPLQLVFQRAVGTRSQASKVEYQIKKLSKVRKETLISGGELFENFLTSR